MSNYRAIVFDLDGTAVQSSRQGMPSARLIAAIKAARAQGMHLFAASGRSLHYGLPVLKALGLTDPCILGGGTQLVDPVTGRTIEESLLSRHSMHQILDAIEPFGSVPFGPSTGGTRAVITKLSDPVPYAGLSVDAKGLTPLMQALAHIPGVTAASAPEWDKGHYIQVTNADATKEHRVRQILGQLGIPKAQTIAVGDANNDIHLFAAAGHRIAMGNASDELKSIADEIAPTIDDDGLAVIIERYTKAYEANRSTPAL